MYEVITRHVKGLERIEADALFRGLVVQLFSAEDFRQEHAELPPYTENGITTVGEHGKEKGRSTVGSDDTNPKS